jgi:nucleoid-associated protein YgaU
MSMGRETRIGVVVIGGLLVLFVTVLGFKLIGGTKPAPGAPGPDKSAAAATPEKSTGEGVPVSSARRSLLDRASGASEGSTQAGPNAWDLAASSRIGGEPGQTQATEAGFNTWTADSSQPQGADWTSQDTATAESAASSDWPPAGNPLPPEGTGQAYDPFGTASASDEPDPFQGQGPASQDHQPQPNPFRSSEPLQPASFTSDGQNGQAEASDELSDPSTYQTAGTRGESSDPFGGGSDRFADTRSGQPRSGGGSWSGPTRHSAAGEHVVRPGDTYWSISEEYYGTGGYFKALIEHNRDDLHRARELAVGDVLSIPRADDLVRDFPGLCPRERTFGQSGPATLQASMRRLPDGGRAYVVEEGDTLFNIARDELGRAARWVEIYDLNADVIGDDIDFLRPGTELVLPREPAPDPIAGREGGRIRR